MNTQSPHCAEFLNNPYDIIISNWVCLLCQEKRVAHDNHHSEPDRMDGFPTDDRAESQDKVSLKPEQTFNYRATTTYTYNHGLQPSQQK